MSNIALYKRSVFFILMFVLVAILTGINNFFFYRTKEITVDIEQKNLINVYSGFYNNCLSESTIHVCQSQLYRVVDSTRAASQIRISKNDGSLLINKELKTSAEQRSIVTTQGEVKDLHFVLSRKSTPPLWHSVFRSMTFSIVDIISNDFKSRSEFIDFVKKIVLPRSYHVLFYCLTIWLLLILFRKQQSSLMNALASAESSLFDTSQKQITAIIKLSKLEEDVKNRAESDSQLKRQYQILSEQLNAEIQKTNQVQQLELEKTNISRLLKQALVEQKRITDDLRQSVTQNDASTKELLIKKNNEVSQLEQRLIQATKQIMVQNQEEENSHIKIRALEVELNKMSQESKDNKDYITLLEEDLKSARSLVNGYEEKIIVEQKKVDYLEEKSDDTSFRRRLINVLLKNPNISNHSGRNKVSEGVHHGKDYIIDLHNHLKSHAIISGFYESITNIRFQHTLRGQARILRDDKKNKYAINIYFDDDRGIGAQIVLCTDKFWEAVLQTKCIFSTIKPLQKYTVKIDDQTNNENHLD